MKKEQGSEDRQWNGLFQVGVLREGLVREPGLFKLKTLRQQGFQQRERAYS